MTKEEAAVTGKPVVSLEAWDAATFEQQQEWRKAGFLMKRGDIKVLQARNAAELRRINFDMSYEGSREFQDDIGS